MRISLRLFSALALIIAPIVVLILAMIVAIIDA